MLPLQRLSGTTTGLLIVIECRINDLWKEFRDRPESLRLMFICPVERLPEYELPRVGVVANIEPVADAAICVRESFVNLRPGAAAVHAADDEVQIVMQIVPSGQMLRDCLPVEPPKIADTPNVGTATGCSFRYVGVQVGNLSYASSSLTTRPDTSVNR